MTIHHCIRCNEPLEEYSVARQNEIIPVGFVCKTDGCDRYGLLTVKAKIEVVKEAV